MTMRRNVSLTIVGLLMILQMREIVGLGDQSRKSNQDLEEQDDPEAPSVLVVLLARNKEINLPYFLTFFERLSYPKKRMLLHIRADRCVDKTIDILEDWLSINQHLYLFVDVVLDRSPTELSNATEDYKLTEDIIEHIVDLKQEALANARRLLVDYILFLDVDVYLTNPDVVSNLIAKNQTVVAPMLDSVNFYSNFWDSLSNVMSTDVSILYSDIVSRRIKGCFQVSIVNSCFLINMRAKFIEQITFDPMDARFLDLPIDDIITFGSSLMRAGLTSYICNDVRSGYVEHELNDGITPAWIKQRFKALRGTMARYEPILSLTTVTPPLAKYIEPPPAVLDKAGLSEIYYINLERRPNRRARMEFMLAEMGLKGRRVNAVDGRKLNQTDLDAMGIKVLSGYEDPYEIRETLTMGEVGCFLSHYKIWKDVIKKGHDSVMILEDDVHFDTNFKAALITAEIELLRSRKPWDFVYLGRKSMMYEEEEPVWGMTNFVHAGLSYWLVGYLLSQSGARKLVQAEPLGKMIPADEFVPLMYNRPHQASWTLAYPKRNLIAYALSPTIVEPQHFNDETVYISDTEGVEGPRFVNGTDRADIPVAMAITEAKDYGETEDGTEDAEDNGETEDAEDNGETEDGTEDAEDNSETEDGTEDAEDNGETEDGTKDFLSAECNDEFTSSPSYGSCSESEAESVLRNDNERLMSALVTLGVGNIASGECERYKFSNKNPFIDTTLK